MNFWEKIEKPIFVLAPMADVTDPAFRRIIAKYSKYDGEDIFNEDGKFKKGFQKSGNLDAMWTEFVSADGIIHTKEKGLEKNYDKLMRNLLYSEAERPIVAQFFTSSPENMRKASKLAVELGFDGVDINMGCPDRSVEKQKAGAVLIKNPELAREIIRDAKKGAGRIPVSVKTRVGYNKDEIDTWIPELLSEEPAVLTIHSRTRKEMSKVPADWKRVKRVVEIRDKMNSPTLILGNGDVLDIEDGKRRVKESGADGIMLGRAIFGNPWLFNEEGRRKVSIEKRLFVMLEHTKLFEEILGDIKSFAIMKKHFKAYIEGWNGAKELRVKLMECENFKEVEKVVNNYLNFLS